MKKLLNFFIPRVVPEIGKIFLVLAVCCLAARLYGISKNALYLIEFLAILVIFPIMSFFCGKITISSNLHWILVSPIEKKDIILSNIVLNIIKFIVISFFSLSYILITYWSKFSGKAPSIDWQNITSGDFITIIITATLIAIIFTGVAAFDKADRQDHMNYKVKPISFFSKDRMKVFICAGLILSASLLLEDDNSRISDFFPPLIASTLSLVFILFLSIYFTLESLRYYYSYKKVVAISLIIPGILCSLLYLNSIANIKTPDAPLKTKIEESLFVGIYGSGHTKEITNNLIEATPAVSLLSRKIIHDYINERTFKFSLSTLKESWENKCEKSQDFTCRLTSYIAPWDKSLEILKQSCPRDVRGCYETLQHPRLSQAEKDIYTKSMKSICSDSESSDNSYCRMFLQQKDKKKKS